MNTACHSFARGVPPGSNRPKAFTLIELLVVIAILASLLLPALTRAKQSALTSVCLSNKHQLGLGCQMYADDFQGAYVLNLDYQATRVTPNWCHALSSWKLYGGSGDWYQTNELALVGPNELLAPYIHRSAKLFKCPADKYYSAEQRSGGYKCRLLSVAMNKFMGGDYSWGNPPQEKGLGNSVITYFKQTDFRLLGPSEIWSIQDVHPDSMFEAYFNMSYDGSEAALAYPNWEMIPGSHHQGGSTLVFADGHAVNHRWLAQSTRQPVRYEPWDYIANHLPDQRDWRWMLTHATEPKTP